MIPLHKDLLIGHTYDVIHVEGNITPAIEWCKRIFGPMGSRWFVSNHKFYFSQAKDAMLFELRF